MGRRAALVRLRVDARRPASWLALAAASGATWLATEQSGSSAVVAIMGGAIAATAAIGALPRGDGRVAWAASRAVWPAVGTAAAWVTVDTGRTAWAAPITVLGAAAATAAAVVEATGAGFAPAAASGVGLALAVAAAVGAAAMAVSPWAAGVWPLGAALAWALAAAAVQPLHRVVNVAGARPFGPFGGALPRAAMVTALVAMVPCLFLAPHLAWGYAGVAAVWMLVVVLPGATLGPGPGGDSARRMLAATSGPRARPGRAAARLVAAYAAVFAWPPLVAAVLDRSGGAAVSVAVAVSVGSLALAGLAALSLAGGWSRDTAHAVALIAAAVSLTVAAAGVAGPANPPIPARGLMLSNPDDPATLP